MILLTTLILANAASASDLLSGQRMSSMAWPGDFERQAQSCLAVPAPYTCEASCGPGYIECVGFPDCYNPSQGEICCSDGKSCAVGHYCTNVGCCSDINSLEDCGAVVSLSTISPSTSPTSSSLTKSTTSVAEKTGSTITSTTRTTDSSRSTTRTTNSIFVMPSSLATSTQLIPHQSSSSLSTITTPNSTLFSTLSVTTSTLSQNTANVGQKLECSSFSFSLFGPSILALLL